MGTILGSMILALFGFSVTAGATALNNIPGPAADSAAVSQPGQAGEQQPADQAAQNPAKKKKANNAGGCQVSGKYPDSILQWCDVITRYARQHDLDPNLVAAVMLQESGGKPLAYSKSGAVGLMQVMPRDGKASSFMCVNGPCFASRPTIAELEDPEFNVEYGTRMLSGLKNRLGNIRDALKSYGPMDVGYYYADIVLSIYERYQ
jgi:hypothetical protein